MDTLPLTVQEQLMAELLDKDAQEELEAGDAVINWAIGAGVCRLHALWNRQVCYYLYLYYVNFPSNIFYLLVSPFLVRFSSKSTGMR